MSSVEVKDSRPVGLSYVGTTDGLAFPRYCLDATKVPSVTVTLADGRVERFDAELQPQCQSFVPILVTRVSYRARGGTLGRLQLAGNDVALVAGGWPGSVQLFDESDYSIFGPVALRLHLARRAGFRGGRGGGIDAGRRTRTATR